MAISDEQILQAAVEVIALNGYAGATTKQIAEAAKMNEVTLFRRFGSKKNLMQRLVEQEAARMGSLDIQYTGELEHDLIKIVTFYQKLMQSRGRVIMMLLSEIPKQPELLQLMEIPMAQMKRITDILVRYQQAGKLIQQSPFTTFTGLVGPLFLGGVLGSTMLASTPPEDTPELIVRRFLHGNRG